jgi:hypothetical protein
MRAGRGVRARIPPRPVAEPAVDPREPRSAECVPAAGRRGHGPAGHALRDHRRGRGAARRSMPFDGKLAQRPGDGPPWAGGCRPSATGARNATWNPALNPGEVLPRRQEWTRERPSASRRGNPRRRGRPGPVPAGRAGVDALDRAGSGTPGRRRPRSAPTGPRGRCGSLRRAPARPSSGGGTRATFRAVAQSRPTAAGSGGWVRAGVAQPARGESGVSGRAFSLARTLS